MLSVGQILPRMGEGQAERLLATGEEAAAHEGFFRNRFATLIDLDIPGDSRASGPADMRTLALAPSVTPAAVVAFLYRLTGETNFDIAHVSETELAAARSFPGFFREALPLRVQLSEDETPAAFSERFEQRAVALVKRGICAADLAARTPGATDAELSVALSYGMESVAGAALTFAFANGRSALIHDRNRIGDAAADTLAGRVAVLAGSFNAVQRMQDLPLMTSEERNRILYGLNESERQYDRTATMHGMIEAQVDRTPHAPAVAAGASELTYRALDERANRIAHALRAAGAGPDVLIGLHVERGVDLVAGALATTRPVPPMCRWTRISRPSA